ncbi:MAG: bifunctional adenosylcobinamide kinase/adenosylcobinamide-phosphate guanylyltransferase [Syntrophobacteraceae bacterium]
MNTHDDFQSPLLVLGGAKSGKSSYAEKLMDCFKPPFVYIATSQILDSEMQERVRIHRERRKDNWETLECPLELPDALRSLIGAGRPVLIDCITLWLSNLLCFSSLNAEEAVDRLCNSIQSVDYPLIIVSNEVGGGIVPDNALARRFRDLSGSANQRLAGICVSVRVVMAGLALRLK